MDIIVVVIMIRRRPDHGYARGRRLPERGKVAMVRSGKSIVGDKDGLVAVGGFDDGGVEPQVCGC